MSNVLQFLLGVVLVIILAVVLRTLEVGKRLAGLSDALWWQLAPWVLLVLLWAVFILLYRRKRRTPTSGK
jgi:uncharacterized BrkB/YihY/UPF0761 family membrane protein